MPSHHRCCNPVVLFSNHSFQFAVLRYLRSFGCRGFSLKTNGSHPTRSPWRKNWGWGFLLRLLTTPSTHLPVQLTQFRHSARKHIVACNGIVIRLHPPWHFTSAVAFHFRRGISLPPWHFTSAVASHFRREKLPLSCRELALSCREFAWSCNFCFCNYTYGPPHPFAVSFSFAARLFLLPRQLWANVELSVI